MAEGRFISYLRVSTKRQGQSGLGLEAQRKAVEDFLNGGRWEHLAEYVEVESGKRTDRPELEKALNHCKVTGATLVIAKLDRLSRDAHFLIGLQKAGAKFRAVDMPEADETVVGIMALFAERERKLISARTKDALAAVKARGTKLGCPLGATHLRQYGNAAGVAKVKEQAQDRAHELAPIIEAIKRKGATSVRGIADELNRMGVITARGGKWHPTSVARLLTRLGISTE
uniref:Resolvase domain protein n=1 Tax=Nitratidesulfovibrio vulgaris (strain DSM 19637 / Miyazaki F) TaxID=883 RepID=B8DJ03_NITV9